MREGDRERMRRPLEKRRGEKEEEIKENKSEARRKKSKTQLCS